MVCVIHWRLDYNSDELREGEDDGTCSSVLDESCRSEMADVVAETWTSRSGMDRCEWPDLIRGSSGDPPAFRQGSTAPGGLDQTYALPSSRIFLSGLIETPFANRIHLVFNNTTINSMHESPGSWPDGKL